MAKKPKAPAPEAQPKPEAEATAFSRKPPRDYAYRLWRSLGRPSLRQLEIRLKENGYFVDDSTLCRWSKEDSRWALEMSEKQFGDIAPATVVEVLDRLECSVHEISNEAYLGLKAKAIARLSLAIDVMAVDTPEQGHQLIDLIQRLDGFIHAMRGKAVVEGEVIPPNAPASLMQRLNPDIVVEPFKKPNGGAH